jgi:glycosyltransferase involved in cell wall biosynthesis
MEDVTCVVCTKNRYEVLSQTLLSIALQTVKPKAIIIFDDSEEPPSDANALVERFPAYGEVFQLFSQYGIAWRVVYGQKRGQHHSHQASQEISTTEIIWRIDDDEIAEPNVLATLLSSCGPQVGAVGGLVLSPSPLPVPPDAANLISDLNLPNVQWFKQSGKLLEVEHLHSTFIYRRGIADYELSLSPAAHREETLFTHSILRKGFKLIVNTDAITWHFRAGQGGIRSHRDPSFWENDERIFQSKLMEWGVNCEPTYPIVLDSGRGDHIIVKSLLPRLKEKYGKILLATCFPDIFDPEPQISIAEAHQRFGNLERFSIYRWCIQHNWQGNLVEAHEKMYGLG